MRKKELDNNEISVKELVLKLGNWRKYLLSKWKLIILAGIICGVIGFIYASEKKTIFKAEYSFALEDDKSPTGLGVAAGLASQFGFDIGGGGGGAFSGDNLLELIKSRSIVEKALLMPVNIKGKNQTLAQLYISYNNLKSKWDNNPALKNIEFLPNADRSKYSLQQDSILGLFYNYLTKESLSVDKIDKKLSIITVKVRSENELFSKLFAENLVKTVSDFYVDTKTKKSVQNVRILQHQTDSIRAELNAAITGVASSADENPNPNPALQILKTPSQKRLVDVQANTAILTELVKNLTISKVSLRKETPLIQSIDVPILPLEKERVGRAKSTAIGLILGGFLMTFLIITKKIYKNIIDND